MSKLKNVLVNENEINNELKKIIEKYDVVEMSNKYRKMVKQWAAYVNLKLNNDYIVCPITLYNEVNHAFKRLELINEYEKYIELCCVLEATIDSEIE
jgi:GTPase Era involved in 16S rRNA processing